MIAQGIDLVLAWAAVLSLVVFLYIVLDGFDLGVGILLPFAAGDAVRLRMIASVAPVWDGNETWLVLGGSALFAAFPQAYAAMMPALYLPLSLMLLALVSRGIAFELHGRSSGAMRRFWIRTFHGGSLLATFAQGLILGALVQRIAVEQGRFAGSLFDCLTPFSIGVGLSLPFGYALLGATWLVMKTDGELGMWAARVARLAAVAVLLLMPLIGVWVVWPDLPAAARWGLGARDIDLQRLLYMAPIPLLVAMTAAGLSMALRSGAQHLPYLFSVLLFLLGYLGLLVGLWPYLVPYAITWYEAAAVPESQAFLLAGTLFLLPLVLGYTAFVYRTFNGKVSDDGTYR